MNGSSVMRDTTFKSLVSTLQELNPDIHIRIKYTQGCSYNAVKTLISSARDWGIMFHQIQQIHVSIKRQIRP